MLATKFLQFSAHFQNKSIAKFQVQRRQHSARILRGQRPHPKTQFQEAYELCAKLQLSNATLHELVKRTTGELKRGLDQQQHAQASVKCYPTHVQQLPTGQEQGKFLAVDLAGSDFRVLLFKLSGKRQMQIASRKCSISKQLRSGCGEELFDYVARCLAKFCKRHQVAKDILPLGFAFNFAYEQQALDRGVLSSWSKGFDCNDVVGQDVVQLLQAALNRREDLLVQVVAVLNAATGTLLACAFKQPACRIGLIVGDSTNACYVEQSKNVQMFENKNSLKCHMLINTEWGAMGEDGALEFMLTPFDLMLDKLSAEPGKRIFEKCISSCYLGELVRLILLELICQGSIFRTQSCERLQLKNQFDCGFICDIESDAVGSYVHCKQVLAELGILKPSVKDMACVRYICEAVSTRSAKLVACGIVALINKMQLQHVVVAIDGSLYRCHPRYHTLLLHNVANLLHPSIRFNIVHTKDGAGVGAALLAALAAESNPPEKCSS
ncbi:hexokinase type 2 [Drosophila busckii]|uniref:hexokinase type 2 n=1 Tax=Drosophila busckii TaxID=30019 RepID=UPI00083ED538|nr:hexokinase type 2 [Drosophila busckii]